MKIPFSEISSTGNRYTLSDLPVPSSCEEFDVQGAVEFSCSLQKKKENRVILQGTVQAALQLRCDRCLSTYPYKVQTDMQLIFEVQPQNHWQLKDMDRVVADLDIIELVEPVIDLEEVGWQQLYMALPVKQICTEHCKGICPECGTNLNITSCSCEGAGKRNPFAVLAELKKK